MNDNFARIQITFRLDDPIQKHAFEVLDGLSRSERRQYICNLIQTNGLVLSEDRLAELIARKVSENLTGKLVSSEKRKQTGRKRGRPPKSAAKAEDKEVSSSKHATELVSQSNPRPVRKRKVSASTTTQYISPKQAEEEILPDDDMLASMSAFVGK